MVILKKCEEYQLDLVKTITKEALEELNFFNDVKEDSRVFIKLNLVGPFPKETGITTHPVILQAVIQLVKEKTNKIIVGDNPATRDMIYTLKKCNLYDVIQEENVELLEGTIFEKITNSNPKIYSTFEVSKQMVDTDVLINLPKLKTHTLAYMTAAQKNFFGLIYGLDKSSWHAKASNPLQFGEAINDLYGAFLEKFKDKQIYHICDGIIGLEGEGPTSGGNPIKANCLLISKDAVALDRVACEVASLDYSKLFINKIANDRKYGNGDINEIKIIGNQLSDFNDIKFKAPKDSLSHIGLRLLQLKPIKNLLLEHPKFIKDKCIKCGECVKICPPHALSIKKKEFPNIKSLSCIRCWCCAEVCPQNAIDRTKRPLLGKIFLKTDKKKK